MTEASSFTISNFTDFKIQMLNWLKPFNIFCFLDNNNYDFEQSKFDCLLAVGSKTSLNTNSGNAFSSLKKFSQLHPGWLFGHLGYDLKNDTTTLASANFDGIGFSDLHFFVPEIVLQLNKNAVKIYSDQNAADIYTAIINAPIVKEADCTTNPFMQERFSKADYISTVQKLQQHILRGDCYEINFCQEFYSTGTAINPLMVYQQLSALSPNPFSAFYRVDDKYCICASPERYLAKRGNTLISQPIKGTAKRFTQNIAMDEISKLTLINSEKEKSENVMVVDLVRNDLSKVCTEGSVEVKELFGIYSFPQVHQMISTIEGQMQNGIDWVDVLQATFPMGSMTGAPKQRVMEIIEDNERTRRGLFSGAIGYIDPTGNFDFNVVIRSILYNAGAKYISMQAGSAITFYSEADKEYEECLLKAAILKKAAGINA